MTLNTAIVEVAKVHQKESDPFCVYAAKFEKYCCFFKYNLTEEAVIALYLNNVHKVFFKFMLF